jgi:hypothetical protein
MIKIRFQKSSPARRAGRLAVAIVCLLLLAVIAIHDFGEPTPAHSRSGPSDGSIQTTVQQNGSQSVTMRMTFPHATVEPDRLIGRGYQRIKIDGTLSNPEIGEPAVPMLTRLVAVPECERIEIQTVVVKSRTIDDVNLVPTPRRELLPGMSGETIDEFVQDDQLFRTNANFPGEFATISNVSHLRRQRLARVSINPVQFNPVTRRASVAEELEVTLVFHNPHGEVFANAGPVANILSSIAVNYPKVGSGAAMGAAGAGGPMLTGGSGQVCWVPTGNDDPSAAASYVVANCDADYLIIVADELVPEAPGSTLVDQLANHRAEYNGFNVAIVTMAQIDSTPDITDTPVLIRDVIKYVYDNGTAEHMGDGLLAYVLLIGDAYDQDDHVLLPSSYKFTQPVQDDKYDVTDACSDSYYSQMSELNVRGDYPDLFIGRIPADYDPTPPVPGDENWELENVVNKILAYEPLSAGAAWTDRVLLASGVNPVGVGLPTQDLTGFQSFFDILISDFIPSDQVVSQYHRLEYPSGGSHDNLSSQRLAEEITSTQYRIVGLFDHGFTTGLAGTQYPLHFDTLNTVGKWPFVLSIASYSMTFDQDEDLRSHLTACDFTIGAGSFNCRAADPHLDPLDAAGERLLLQPGGAIGGMGISRTGVGYATALEFFRNFFENHFQDNASQLGELNLLGKIHPSVNAPAFNLHLLGDPAVNIFWESDESELDSLDVALGQNDITFTNAAQGIYVDAGTALQVEVVIHNLWKVDAVNVLVELWLGVPGEPGSTFLSSTTASTVVAHESAVVNLSASGLSTGAQDLYVRLAPPQGIIEPTYENNVAKKSVTVFAYEPGFPIEVATGGSITIAEVNGAHVGKEILAGDGATACISATGESIWSLNGTPETSVANLLKDGVPHVVTVGNSSSGGTWIYVINVGTTPPQSHGQFLIPSTGSVDRPFGFVDIDGDGILETLIYRPVPSSVSDILEAFTPDGTRSWGTLANTFHATYGSLAVGNLDSDGTPEIVLGIEELGADSVEVYDAATGRRIWAASVGDIHATVSVVLADFDDDGEVEILANGADAASAREVLHALDNTGSILWSIPLSKSVSNRPPLFSAGDIDGDGDLEAAVATWDSLLVIDPLTSSVLELATSGPDNTYLTKPLLVDIDDDGACEIIVVAHVVEDYTDNDYIELRTFDASLDPTGTWYQFAVGDGVATDFGHPAVADIDDDGVYEIVIGSPDGVLHAFEIGTSAGLAEWPQKHANPMHTNLYKQPIKNMYFEPTSLFGRCRMVANTAFRRPTYLDRTASFEVKKGGSWAEVKFQGGVEVAGTASDPVEFFTDPPSVGSPGWNGVVIDNLDTTTTSTFNHFVVKDARRGVDVRTPATLSNGTIGPVFYNGIKATADVTVENVVVTEPMLTTTVGLYALAGASVDVDGSTFSSLPKQGIYCNDCDALTVTNSTLNDNETGILVKSAIGSIADCVITGNEDGILLDSASPSIESCRLDDNHLAVGCDNGSGPRISYSSIQDGHMGVLALNGSYPHLGDGSIGGHNCFKNNTSYDLTVFSDPIFPVYAQNNYWGRTCCPASELQGNIICNDCVPEQCTPPGPNPSSGGGSDTDSGRDELPTIAALRPVVPNPFNPQTTVHYEVPEPGGHVSISVYDVRGKLVVDLVDQRGEPGFHRVTWRGLDRHGSPVSTGVYFVRMETTNYVHTVKAVMLK